MENARVYQFKIDLGFTLLQMRNSELHHSHPKDTHKVIYKVVKETERICFLFTFDHKYIKIIKANRNYKNFLTFQIITF